MYIKWVGLNIAYGNYTSNIITRNTHAHHASRQMYTMYM